MAACHVLATPWHYISDTSSSSRSRGFTNQANTGQRPPTFAPLGDHGQYLPSKPAAFGKQFGQDHTRGKFQKRLLVKHPASVMFFFPHQRASPLPRPSAGNVSSLSSARVKILVLVGLSCADRDLTDVARRKSQHVPAAREHCASFRFQLQRRYLVINNCHSRQASCKARRLIMHLHANPALGTGCYSPRKLHPFQGVKGIAKSWLPSSWPTSRTHLSTRAPPGPIKDGAHVAPIKSHPL